MNSGWFPAGKDEPTIGVSEPVEASSVNGHDVIEVDLSGTTFMDCGGLGALIALRNATRDRKRRVRLLNPTPPVEQVLHLLEAQRVFEIVTAQPGC